MDYKIKSDFDLAVADFEKSISLNAKDPYVYNKRAALWVTMKDLKKAAADIKKVQALGGKPDPEVVKALKPAKKPIKKRK
jgi:hypothetical protein